MLFLVLAEVMDKEPTLSEVWRSGLLGAAVAWVLGRRLPAFGWLALLPLGTAIGALFECYDLGPAILREAGAGYVAQTHFAVGFAGLAFVFGLLGRRHEVADQAT